VDTAPNERGIETPPSSEERFATTWAQPDFNDELRLKATSEAGKL
jgi:hypothetical protein